MISERWVTAAKVCAFILAGVLGILTGNITVLRVDEQGWHWWP